MSLLPSQSTSRVASDLWASPFGDLLLAVSERGVVAIQWRVEGAPDPFEQLLPSGRTGKGQLGDLIRSVKRQLEEYFRRDRTVFELPLDLRGTPFQQRAWSALLTIPYGETMSYQDQAIRLGSARWARAVGAANRSNPIAIVVPCHRVIGKGGELTGYAAGLDLKRRLLELEAAHFRMPAPKEFRTPPLQHAFDAESLRAARI